MKRLWLALELVVLVPLALGLVGVAAILFHFSRQLPDVRVLAAYRPSQTTQIRSSDGVLLARIFDENREVVPLSRIPQDLRYATVAVEDHRFFEHHGVDWRGTMRALVADIRDRHYDQGGSTLTQQLVRNVFLRPDKRLSRKIKEAMLAVQLERHFSKQDILAMYLNQVYYGERCFGVQAASRAYFGKPVQKLTLAEAALIAGIPQRPSYYDPYDNPQAAVRRRNLVLKRMADTGFLDVRRAREAMNQPLRLAYRQPPHLTARLAPYFVDYVVKELEDRYGAETVYRGGLRVQTTLNTRAQAAAEAAVHSGMNRWFGRRSTQAALVSLDPTNGYIRAMVGGRDYARSPFNRAVQAKRQPGSAFKPFVYAAAMDAGMTPNDIVVDAPITFKDTHWTPHNYDGRWHGAVTLTQALAESINIPAIKVLDRIGPSQAAAMAHACGIRSDLREDLTLALGTSEVSVLEMASAYGTFADGGQHTDPVAITEVRDSRGDIIDAAYPTPEPVVDESVARRIDYMLRQVVRMGTGRNAGTIPTARGKTGTTSDLKDAWFVGYTPDLVTAVWVGNDTPVRIPGATGGGLCAPIWTAYMQRALAILPHHPDPEALKPLPPAGKIEVAEQTPPTRVAAAGSADAPEATDNEVYGSGGPDTVQRRVCLYSGDLATPNCPQTAVESFPRGTEPTEYCTVHSAGAARQASRIVTLCQDTGDLAGPNCPNVITVRLQPGEPLPPPCTVHNPSRRSRTTRLTADPYIMPPEPPSGE